MDDVRFTKGTFFCHLHKGHVGSNHHVQRGMQSRFPGTLTSCSPQGHSVKMSRVGTRFSQSKSPSFP